MAKQDANTGLAIIRRMKELINEFHPLYIHQMEKIKQQILSGDFSPVSPFSERMQALVKEMNCLCDEYGELPAYKTYRFTFYDEITKNKIDRLSWFLAGKPEIPETA